MSIPWLDGLLANRFVNRAAHKAIFALVMVACIGWSAAAAWRAPVEAEERDAADTFQEWPDNWDGVPLRPLALSDVERRFADRFPGAIARMTDGESAFVLRRVTAPTRMLHPAADCYRALGYRIEAARLERDAQARLWRCFVADGHSGQSGQGNGKLRVCERIVDARGVAFTDTSAWYWSAASGESHGPWQAVTLARRIE